ncbi:MAG: hypothetical protein KJ558_08175 [Gammaproteobacteria bacterium]|nr:hypothetical protein [Gammaproteobacteria bacterium]MBU1654789.1 hypothetical protein [Gammaproteobacteria bacterium]MBU1961440.1 hypothetical protein [Gammaproteobacteria bacterium]
MTDLSQITDTELVLEIYRRIKRDDELGSFRNYCYRSAFRPIFIAFDRADIDEANLRMYQCPDWTQLEADRDTALRHFPDPEAQ